MKEMVIGSLYGSIYKVKVNLHPNKYIIKIFYTIKISFKTGSKMGSKSLFAIKNIINFGMYTNTYL